MATAFAVQNCHSTLHWTNQACRAGPQSQCHFSRGDPRLTHQAHHPCILQCSCQSFCRRAALVSAASKSNSPAAEVQIAGHEDITDDYIEDYLEGEDAVLDAGLDSGMESLYDEDDGEDVIEEASEEEEQYDNQLSPSAASIDVDKTPWGRQALEVARKVLQMQELKDLELYSFQAVAKGTGLDVRLDKVSDRYGSPSMDEVEIFARAFYRELEAALGEEEAGAITVEVSSPGANRELQIPKELKRFKDLPMAVTYRVAFDDAKISNRVLQILELQEAEGQSTWGLADVKVNRTNAKGTKLTRKQAAERFVIPLKSLQIVKLYVDF